MRQVARRDLGGWSSSVCRPLLVTTRDYGPRVGGIGRLVSPPEGIRSKRGWRRGVEVVMNSRKLRETRGQRRRSWMRRGCRIIVRSLGIASNLAQAAESVLRTYDLGMLCRRHRSPRLASPSLLLLGRQCRWYSHVPQCCGLENLSAKLDSLEMRKVKVDMGGTSSC